MLENLLKFASKQTFLSSIFRLLVFRLPIFSYICGWFQKMPWTRFKVKKFIEKYDININEFEKTKFSSFDDFFTRKLKKGARSICNSRLIASADGKYSVCLNVSSENEILVKGKKLSLLELLGDEDLYKKYLNSAMIMVRLSLEDYHRFHFPADCVPQESKLINGALFSVQPTLLKFNLNLLTENKRKIAILKTHDLGDIVCIVIGATCVGSINMTYSPGKEYKKGDEMGYFALGGSMIIYLIKNNNLQIIDDIVKNSSQYIETACKMGQKLAD